MNYILLNSFLKTPAEENEAEAILLVFSDFLANKLTVTKFSAAMCSSSFLRFLTLKGPHYTAKSPVL